MKGTCAYKHMPSSCIALALSNKELNYVRSNMNIPKSRRKLHTYSLSHVLMIMQTTINFMPDLEATYAHSESA